MTLSLSLKDAYFFSRPVHKYAKQLIEKRFVDCFEIDIITESNGGMYINDHYYPVKKGDTVFRYPGQTTQGVIPYSCYAIRFQTDDSLFIKTAEKAVPGVSSGESTRQILPIIESVLNERIDHNMLSNYFYDYQLSKLVYSLLMLFHPNSNKYEDDQSNYNPYVSECISFIQLHWKNVTINDLVNRTGVSKPYLMKLFKQTTGKTILNYINDLKLEHIKKMLIFTGDNLTEIALNCGFNSSSYFTYYFSKHTGLSPKEFRNIYRI